MLGEHTWERCGKKDVAQLEVKDKWVVTCFVLVASYGHMLPFQIVCKGKTKNSLPTKALECKRILRCDFKMTLSHNH